MYNIYMNLSFNKELVAYIICINILYIYVYLYIYKSKKL